MYHRQHLLLKLGIIVQTSIKPAQRNEDQNPERDIECVDAILQRAVVLQLSCQVRYQTLWDWKPRSNRRHVEV